MMSPGTKLGGRYRLDERIATGGMGDVWRATDEVLGRVVAVKVLLPSLLNEPGFIERFRGEARVVATLTHPNVVRVYDYGESPMQGGGQIAYLVMEFVEGEALTARLQRQGRLTAEEALPILAQAAEALDAAHKAGIVHRDVKPGNLLLTGDGKVMLTDFGIARSALTGGLTQAGSVLGTAAYISPEQASGQGVTGQSDVYSLGIVAYQCLAGRRPFDSDNPVELAMRHVNDEPPPLPDDVPAAARAVVAAALAKDTSQRFATGEAMAQAARAAVGGEAMQLSPAGSPPIAPTSPQT
ncbi:serine/threonine-protein kinase, partial [Stackebrandtia sp.]|uniref:serine/threonine-protein kinase n=1 Tax=Stackebrandtia sp. TaxID=2023065 RepID=UPI0032C24659